MAVKPVRALGGFIFDGVEERAVVRRPQAQPPRLGTRDKRDEMQQRRTNNGGRSELRKGSAETLILALLEERDRHGYEIAKLIDSRSAAAARTENPDRKPSQVRRIAD